MQCKDQLGRILSFSKTPSRIVSLVPSQTELLVDLGLRKNLVGITKFCVHPKDLRKEIDVVGGTKQIDFEKIKNLNPDIVICNKEENTEEIVSNLEQIAPVYVSDIATISESLQMISDIGKIFSVDIKSENLIEKIESNLKDFKKFTSKLKERKVVYLIWKEPLMAAGTTVFINDLLKLNKWQNVLILNSTVNNVERYPIIDENILAEAEIILFSSEPFPFKKETGEYYSKKFGNKFLMVDGEYFSWYGSRLAAAFDYFKTLHNQL